MDINKPYKPSQSTVGDIVGPRPEEASSPPTRPQFNPPAPKPSKGPGKLRKGLSWLLVLVLIAGAAAGAYFWQDMKLSDLRSDNTSLQQRIDSLESEADESEDETANETEGTLGTTQTDLVTGQATQEAAGSEIVVTCRTRPSTLDQLWVQYGDTAATAKRTEARTDGLGEGGLGDDEPNLLFARKTTAVRP